MSHEEMIEAEGFYELEKRIMLHARRNARRSRRTELSAPSILGERSMCGTVAVTMSNTNTTTTAEHTHTSHDMFTH
jgi:hypothetical protein